MPEAQPENTVETTGETETEDSSQQEAQKPTETVEFWKSKAREQEKRAKENAKAAERLSELEESQKTELQKAIDRAEAAERALDEQHAANQVQGWKADAAEKFGVPADVLRGTNADEIFEHAAKLKALLPEPRPGHVPTEGRTVTTGGGDPAHQFANILKQQLSAP
jgi:hypothetical protein